MQTIAIFDTIHFGLRKRRPIFQVDFINIHVTNACTLVKHVNFELNSFVNHTTPLCLQNMHMLYLRMDVLLSLVMGMVQDVSPVGGVCGTLQYHYTAMFPQVGWYRMCILFELCVHGDVPCRTVILLWLTMVDGTGHVSC